MSHQLLWFWIQTRLIHVSFCLMIWSVWDTAMIIDLFLIIQRDLTSITVFWVSEGFNSGTHCWDVEVKQSLFWSLGVTTASNQRKGRGFFNTGVWCVWYGWSPGSGFHVKQHLERVRVNLDYDRGTVSFSDPVTNTHLHTFTTSFTHTLFPFFWCIGSLRILSINSQ